MVIKDGMTKKSKRENTEMLKAYQRIFVFLLVNCDGVSLQQFNEDLVHKRFRWRNVSEY
jgi:hypothetical protein